jgi:hypothetical protein
VCVNEGGSNRMDPSIMSTGALPPVVLMILVHCDAVLAWPWPKSGGAEGRTPGWTACMSVDGLASTPNWQTSNSGETAQSLEVRGGGGGLLLIVKLVL